MLLFLLCMLLFFKCHYQKIFYDLKRSTFPVPAACKSSVPIPSCRSTAVEIFSDTLPLFYESLLGRDFFIADQTTARATAELVQKPFLSRVRLGISEWGFDEE